MIGSVARYSAASWFLSRCAAGKPGRRIWKKGFYERVIREYGGEYGRIAQYIVENPMKWR